MLPIQRMITKYNFSKGRNGHKIKYLVLHYTANKGDTAENNAKYFNRNLKAEGKPVASAHYFVSDKQIFQVVEDEDTAYAVGGGTSYGALNSNSLSIEMCCWIDGTVSKTTEENTLELTKYLMDKHGISINNVIRHYDCNSIRKVCPNWSDNNWRRWWDFKAKLEGKEIENIVVGAKPIESKPQVDTKPKLGSYEYARNYANKYLDIKDIQKKLDYLGYSMSPYGVDGSYGQHTFTKVKEFQVDTGLAVDGNVGNITLAKLNEKYNAKVQANSRRESKLLEKVKYKQVVYGKSGSHVYLLQSILTELGYNVNGIDGHCGNGLTNAIKAYQRNNGLTVDGSCYVEMWTHILTK